jgi:hypothetical protein
MPKLTCRSPELQNFLLLLMAIPIPEELCDIVKDIEAHPFMMRKFNKGSGVNGSDSSPEH